MIIFNGTFVSGLKAKYSGVYKQEAEIYFNSERDNYRAEFSFPENALWSDFPLNCEAGFRCELHLSDFVLYKDISDYVRFSVKNIVSEIRLFDNKERSSILKDESPACVCKSGSEKSKKFSRNFSDKILLYIENTNDSKDKQYLYTILAGVFGKGEYLPEHIKQIFYESGLLHLLVVSGYHLASLMIFVSLLVTLIIKFNLKFLNYYTESQLGVMAGFIMLMLFLFLIDLNLPVYRAIISYLICSYLIFNSYFILRVRVLFQVLAIIIIFFPLSVFSLSVQLTFSALLGLIFANYIISKALFYKLRPPILAKFIFLNTFAYFGTIPIQYYWFSSLNLKSVLFNLMFSVPFTLFVIICGAIISLLLQLNFPFVSVIINFISFCFDFLINAMEFVLSFF